MAVNCCWAPGAIDGFAGATVTLIVRHSPSNSTWPAGHLTVTVALPLRIRRVVAVTVTAPGFDGAVNAPPASIVPSLDVQSKSVSPSFVRALNDTAWPTSTVADGGVTNSFGLQFSIAAAKSAVSRPTPSATFCPRSSRSRPAVRSSSQRRTPSSSTFPSPFSQAPVAWPCRRVKPCCAAMPPTNTAHSQVVTVPSASLSARVRSTVVIATLVAPSASF